MLCISAAYAVVQCLSVCLSWVSVTFVYSVETNKQILKLFFTVWQTHRSKVCLKKPDRYN